MNYPSGWNGRSWEPLVPRKPLRPQRTKEVYAVTCWRCETDVEVECRRSPHHCPACGVPLNIEGNR